MNSGEADPLLFEPYVWSEAIFDEVAVERVFGLREMWLRRSCRVGFGDELGSVVEEGRFVHEDRCHVGEAGAELVEDREAVGVDVTPSR